MVGSVGRIEPIIGVMRLRRWEFTATKGLITELWRIRAATLRRRGAHRYIPGLQGGTHVD
jgi:hypothetical protein